MRFLYAVSPFQQIVDDEGKLSVGSLRPGAAVPILGVIEEMPLTEIKKGCLPLSLLTGSKNDSGLDCVSCTIPMGLPAARHLREHSAALLRCIYDANRFLSRVGWNAVVIRPVDVRYVARIVDGAEASSEHQRGILAALLTLSEAVRKAKYPEVDVTRTPFLLITSPIYYGQPLVVLDFVTRNYRRGSSAGWLSDTESSLHHLSKNVRASIGMASFIDRYLATAVPPFSTGTSEGATGFLPIFHAQAGVALALRFSFYLASNGDSTESMSLSYGFDSDENAVPWGAVFIKLAVEWEDHGVYLLFFVLLHYLTGDSAYTAFPPSLQRMRAAFQSDNDYAVLQQAEATSVYTPRIPMSLSSKAQQRHFGPLKLSRVIMTKQQLGRKIAVHRTVYSLLHQARPDSYFLINERVLSPTSCVTTRPILTLHFQQIPPTLNEKDPVVESDEIARPVSSSGVKEPSPSRKRIRSHLDEEFNDSDSEDSELDVLLHKIPTLDDSKGETLEDEIASLYDRM